jgi:glycosyltransferase involved in cell wall biosynthesis
VIIGEGPEKEKLIKFAEVATKVKSQIHFVDWIIPFQRELKDFSLYICSSKNEGTSVSVIEAMVAKIPVISTSVGGMKDLLLNGERGQLVESENALELQKAIQNQVNLIKIVDHKNKDLFYSKLDQVSDSVKNQFDCRRLYDEIDVLYKGLYQKNKA